MSKKTTINQSVFGLVLDEERQTFVAIRTSNDSIHRGRIHLPGGKIEKGERPSEALWRELFEELSLQKEMSLSTDWIFTHKIKRGREVWQEHYFVVVLRDETVSKMKEWDQDNWLAWSRIDGTRRLYADYNAVRDDARNCVFTGAYMTGVSLFRYVDELFNTPRKVNNYQVEKHYRKVLKYMQDFPRTQEQLVIALDELDKATANCWTDRFAREVGARSLIFKIRVLAELEYSIQHRDRMKRELVDLGRILRSVVEATAIE